MVGGALSPYVAELLCGDPVAVFVVLADDVHRVGAMGGREEQVLAVAGDPRMAALAHLISMHLMNDVDLEITLQMQELTDGIHAF